MITNWLELIDNAGNLTCGIRRIPMKHLRPHQYEGIGPLFVEMGILARNSNSEPSCHTKHAARDSRNSAGKARLRLSGNAKQGADRLPQFIK